MPIEAEDLEGDGFRTPFVAAECNYDRFQTPTKVLHSEHMYDNESDDSPISILSSSSKIDPDSSREFEGNRSSEGSISGDGQKDEDKSKLLPESKSPEGSSTLGSIFLIVNAALGAGLLNMPKAFDDAGGVMTAILVQAVLLFFIMSALIILAKTSNINKSCTLQEVDYSCLFPCCSNQNYLR